MKILMKLSNHIDAPFCIAFSVLGLIILGAVLN